LEIIFYLSISSSKTPVVHHPHLGNIYSYLEMRQNVHWSLAWCEQMFGYARLKFLYHCDPSQGDAHLEWYTCRGLTCSNICL